MTRTPITDRLAARRRIEAIVTVNTAPVHVVIIDTSRRSS